MPSYNLTPAQLQVGSNSAVGNTVVNAARKWLGTTYAWGGGTKDGPSQGIHDGGVADSFGDYNKIGFDCSGLTLYAWAQAGVTLPRTSSEQYSFCTPVPKGQEQAGDLNFYGSPVHHVNIWTGQNGTIIEAPESGGHVQEIPFYTSNGYRGTSRPSGGSVSSVLDSSSVSAGNTGTTDTGVTSNVGKWAMIGAIAIIALIIVFTQAV